MTTPDNKLPVLGPPEETEVTPSELGAGPIPYVVRGDQAIIDPEGTLPAKEKQKLTSLAEQTVGRVKPEVDKESGKTLLEKLTYKKYPTYMDWMSDIESKEEGLGQLVDQAKKHPIATAATEAVLEVLDLLELTSEVGAELIMGNIESERNWHNVEQGGGLSRYLFEKGVAHPEESNEIARAIFKKFIGSGEIPEEYMDMSLYEAMRKIQDNFQERGTAEQFRLEIPVMIAQAVLAWAKSPLDIGRSLKKVIDTKALEKHLSKEKVKNIKIANTHMPDQFKKVFGSQDLEDYSDIRFMEDAGITDSGNVFKELKKHKQDQFDKVISIGNSYGDKWENALEQVFEIGDDMVVSKYGETIQDMAARLPEYWAKLTPDEQKVLIELREALVPFRTMTDDIGIDIKEANILKSTKFGVPDGFYIPRGQVEQGPRTVVEGHTILKSVSSYRKERTYGTMKEGINDGAQYVPIGQAIAKYVSDVGDDVTNRWIGNILKESRYTDGRGKVHRIVSTPQQQVMQERPDLIRNKDRIEKELNQLKSLVKELGKQRYTKLKGASSFLKSDVLENIKQLDNYKGEDGAKFVNQIIKDLNKFKNDLPGIVKRGKFRGYVLSDQGAVISSTDGSWLKTKNLSQLIDEFTDQLNKAKGEYKDAVKAATKPSKQLEGLPAEAGLQNYQVEDFFAKELREAFNQKIIPTGDKDWKMKGLDALQAGNQIYRSVKATGDVSALGIQGMLLLYDNPRAWANVAWHSLHGLRDGKAWKKFQQNADNIAKAEGRLDSIEWAREGVHFGGSATELTAGFGLQVTEKVTAKIGLKRPLDATNRSFGFFGDMARLKWADDMLAQELAKGRNISEIKASGDLKKIAEAVNNQTGWARTRFGGDLGEQLMFAPRYFQSRLNTLANAVQGFAPGASLEKRLARRAATRMFAFGSTATFMLNEMQGHGLLGDRSFNYWDANLTSSTGETYANPNFMRVRAMGQDISLFGPWDSMYKLIRSVQGAATKGEASRVLSQSMGMASGLQRNMYILIMGETPFGEPSGTGFGMAEEGLVEREFDAGTLIHRFLLENLLPFSGEELGAQAKLMVQGIVEKDIKKIAQAGGGTVMKVTGLKSAPLSPSENLMLARRGHYTEYGIEDDADWSNIPRDIQFQIGQEPDVRSAQVAKDNDEKGRRGQRAQKLAFDKKIDDVDIKYDNPDPENLGEIQEAYKKWQFAKSQLGADRFELGEEYRKKLTELSKQRAQEKALIRREYGRYLDIKDPIDNTQIEVNEFNDLVDRYYDVLLDDSYIEEEIKYDDEGNIKERKVTGFNFQKQQAAVENLRAKVNPTEWDRLQKYVNRNESKPQEEYRIAKNKLNKPETVALDLSNFKSGILEERWKFLDGLRIRSSWWKLPERYFEALDNEINNNWGNQTRKNSNGTVTLWKDILLGNLNNNARIQLNDKGKSDLLFRYRVYLYIPKDDVKKDLYLEYTENQDLKYLLNDRKLGVPMVKRQFKSQHQDVQWVLTEYGFSGGEKDVPVKKRMESKFWGESEEDMMDPIESERFLTGTPIEQGTLRTLR